MSYRELRNFTEMLRALGYQRLVSVENFREPNFELVASVLYWLVKRYDPEISVSDSIESEDDRVHFLTTVAQVMQAKAKVKLNMKRIYAADGRAVKELLKVASVLYSANREQTMDDSAAVAPLNSRIKDIKLARSLATEITSKGARLHDLLAKEKEVKPDRDRALAFLDTISSNLDSTQEQQHIAKSVNALMAQIQETIETTKRQCDELAADEQGLDAKIKKKQAELERHEKRLKSLQTVRPAFMDEYENVERELQKHYEVYLERFRNLDYLQFELEAYNKSEKENMDENDRSLKRMQKRLREEELRIMRGEQDLKSESGGGATTSGLGTAGFGAARPDGGATGAAAPTKGHRAGDTRGKHVQGSMTAKADASDSDDIDSDEGSHDSDSESVSIAPSSNNGSDVDIGDDDGSDMSDAEESHYASGQSSNEF